MNNVILIKNILKSKGKFTLNLIGNSMYPTYKEGDKVTIITADTISIGDIILFNVQGVLIFHRVIEFNKNYIITKGDNHEYCDTMISRSQVLGKALIPYNNIDNSTPKKHFTFCIHGIDYDENLNEILSIDNIKIEKNSILKTNDINICISPVANHTINYILPKIQNYNGIIKFHFNVKISNIHLDGYHLTNEFNYIVRPAKRIISSLLTIEQQIIMTLGNIYGMRIN